MANPVKATVNTTTSSQHVIIGVLVGFDDSNRPLVAFPDNPHSTAIAASYTLPLQHKDVGSNLAILLIGGDVKQPMIIGPVKNSLEPAPDRSSEQVPPLFSSVFVDDDDELTVSAKKTITLQCGDSSLTLTKDGKILLRGKYISSRASGMQTIKGGSVQIN